MASFGAWLNARLEHEGLDSGDLVQRIPISRQSVNKWLNDQSVPKERHIRRLAAILHTTEREIYDALGRDVGLNILANPIIRRIVDRVAALSPQEQEHAERLVDAFFRAYADEGKAQEAPSSEDD